MPFETDEIAEVVTLAELQEFLADNAIDSVTIGVNLARGYAGITFHQRANSFTGEGKTLEEALQDGWSKRPWKRKSAR